MINSYAMHVDKLNPEYKDVFTRVRDYVISKEYDEIKNEEILSGVIDSFLEAQQDEKNVNQIIGGSVENYCKRLCEENDVKSHILFSFELFNPIFTFLSLMAFCEVVEMIGKITDGKNINVLTYKSREGIIGYLIGGGILLVSAIISDVFVRKNIFKMSVKKCKRIAMGIRFAAIVVIFLIFAIFANGKEEECMYLWMVVAVCVAWKSVYFFLTKHKREYKKENKISLFDIDSVKEEMVPFIDKLENDRFEKLKKKNLRKGKGETSFAEFLEYEKKDLNKFDKKPVVYVAIAIGGTIIGLIVCALTGGFPSVFDLLFFIGIMLLAEGVMMYFVYKACKPGWKQREEWVDAKLNQNKEEYWSHSSTR